MNVWGPVLLAVGLLIIIACLCGDSTTVIVNNYPPTAQPSATMALPAPATPTNQADTWTLTTKFVCAEETYVITTKGPITTHCDNVVWGTGFSKPDYHVTYEFMQDNIGDSHPMWQRPQKYDNDVWSNVLIPSATEFSCHLDGVSRPLTGGYELTVLEDVMTPVIITCSDGGTRIDAYVPKVVFNP